MRNPSAIQETWVQSLGWEDLLENAMATHSSILAWRILWTEEPGGLQSIGSQSQTRLKRLSTHAPTILPLGPFISSGQYQTLKAFSEA